MKSILLYYLLMGFPMIFPLSPAYLSAVYFPLKGERGNLYEKGNLEIHSADAGIDTDSDSNNARGNELYIAPSPYPLP